MGKLNLNLLKGIEEQENVIDSNRKEQEDAGNIVQDTPQASKAPAEQLQTRSRKSVQKKTEKKENIKPVKAVMGFRAETEKMEDWKLYASVTGQEIGVLCTAAIDEYIKHHELTTEQQKLFDLKKQVLEVEKKIKKQDSTINS